MDKKFENLKNYLKTLETQGVCLAFSGGIDSALLLHICAKTLSTERFCAVTFKSEFQTEDEIEFCKNFTENYAVNHDIIRVSNLSDPIIQNNPKDRCYHCKKGFFTRLKEFAAKCNFKNVIDGTNFDDLSCYRPGLKALEELNIISPLAEFKITKPEIRQYAKFLGLKIFNKPSTPCLATRFPYKTRLNIEDLTRVEAAEKILHNSNFTNCRVRFHKDVQNSDIARVEIPSEDFCRFIKSPKITGKLKDLGFKYVTLDLEGLRQGGMDD